MTFHNTVVYHVIWLKLGMCLWNMDTPGGNKVKIWQNLWVPYFDPAQPPRGLWCQLSASNPQMNL